MTFYFLIPLGLVGCTQSQKGLIFQDGSGSSGEVSIGKSSAVSPSSSPTPTEAETGEESAAPTELPPDQLEETATALANLFLTTSTLSQNSRVIQFSLNGQVATEACASHEEKRFNFVAYDFGNQMFAQFSGKLPGPDQAFLAPYFPALKKILKDNPKYSGLKIRFSTLSSAQEALLPLHSIFNETLGFPDLIYITNTNGIKVATPKWLPRISDTRPSSNFAAPGLSGSHLITAIYGAIAPNKVGRYFRLSALGTLTKLFSSNAFATDGGTNHLLLAGANADSLKQSGGILYAHEATPGFFKSKLEGVLAESGNTVKPASGYLLFYPAQNSFLGIMDKTTGDFKALPKTLYLSTYSHLNGTNINYTEQCLL
jgi:hypothetical protein